MLAIAAVAGALVVGGCVSAAAKPPAAAAAASARAATAAGGTANIMIYGVNTDGAYWHAIISGVVGDYGRAVSIYPRRPGRPGAQQRDGTTADPWVVPARHRRS